MERLSRDKKVVVMTGAGISAESGIKTFRDSGGLWEDHRIEDVATPQAFVRNPLLVWNFYRQRYLQSIEAKPNPAHYSLLKLEQYLGDSFHLITQNVDGLHTRAGSKNVLEMHGSLRYSLCAKCRERYPLTEVHENDPIPICPACKTNLRPDIVWFGEVPYFLVEIEKILKQCEILLIVGTSGVVYPAAGFVMTAKYFGAKTIAINLDQPDNRSFIDEFIQGKSGEILPELVQAWIS